MHSITAAENKVFFMYDIEWHNDDVYLIINVTDYGKTIVHNVQKYYQEKYGQTIEAMESIRWHGYRKYNTFRLRWLWATYTGKLCE